MNNLKNRQRAAIAKTRKRILILDDHPMTRYGLVQLIKHEPDLMVCGEADTAQTAMGLIKSSRPDLVVSDITMSGKSGLEFIKDMRAEHSALPVLVLSMHDETIYAERVLRSGGRGYIMKSEGGAKVLKAIRKILKGEIYLSEKLSSAILDDFAGRRQPATSALSRLTDREFETFQLIGRGLTTREIARHLHISPKTVDTHRLHLKEKLQLPSLPALMKYALRWGATQEMI